MNLLSRIERLEAETVSGPTHEEWLSYLDALSDRSPAGCAVIAAFEGRGHDQSAAHLAAIESLR